MYCCLLYGRLFVSVFFWGEGLYSADGAAGVCIVALGGEEGDVVMLQIV